MTPQECLEQAEQILLGTSVEYQPYSALERVQVAGTWMNLAQLHDQLERPRETLYDRLFAPGVERLEPQSEPQAWPAEPEPTPMAASMGDEE